MRCDCGHVFVSALVGAGPSRLADEERQETRVRLHQQLSRGRGLLAGGLAIIGVSMVIMLLAQGSLVVVSLPGVALTVAGVRAIARARSGLDVLGPPPDSSGELPPARTIERRD